jgi:hypothetical protein
VPPHAQPRPCAFQKLHVTRCERLHRLLSCETLFCAVGRNHRILTKRDQIFLKGLSEKTGSKIYGKAEFQNPGGSTKDRAALGVIEAAEADGRCVCHVHHSTYSDFIYNFFWRAMMHIVVSNQVVRLSKAPQATRTSASRTSAVPRATAVSSTCQTQSQEKIDLLRMLGANVRPVPAVPTRTRRTITTRRATMHARPPALSGPTNSIMSLGTDAGRCRCVCCCYWNWRYFGGRCELFEGGECG